MRSISIFRFQGYAVDLAARVIRHGGAVVEVEAKVFDLIALLLENRDQALSKREINKALWGERPVTDAALSQLLSKARRALGDDGDHQQVIRTVHGRGLQWSAPIEVENRDPTLTDPPETSDRSRKTRALWLAAFAALLAVLAALLVPQSPPSAGNGKLLSRIAILPILDRTGEKDLAWTRNGLMGLISSLLQEQGRVEVIGSQIVQDAIRGRDSLDAAALLTLRESLGATHLIQGELRRVGSLYELDLRFDENESAQRHDILRGASPAPLAVDAAARIQRWLGVASPSSSSDEGSDVRDPFLAEAYARGLDASAHGDEAGAMKYYQICLDQDPGLLWPRLRLARAQGNTNQQEASIENATKVAEAARRNGNDDLLIQALRQLSAIAYYKGDGDAAARYLDEALSKFSDDSRPLSLAGVHSTYGAVEIKRGHLDQAREHLQRALPLTRAAGNRRGEASVLINLAIIEVERGNFGASFSRFREAIDVARQCGAKDLEMRALGGFGAAEFDAGQALAAVPMLSGTLTLAKELVDQQTTVHVATNLARVLAIFGRHESAEALIQQALDIGRRQNNPAWQAKAWWAKGINAEQQGNWPGAIAALGEAHRLFAQIRANLDDVAVLVDSARVATRAGDAGATRAAASALADVIESEPGNPKLAVFQPLVLAEATYASGHHAEALAALQQWVDANASRLDWSPRLDALLQLGRWRLEQHDAGAALAAVESLTPWIEQYPDVIELHIAALRAAGKTEQASAEQARLDALKASPDLDISVDLLSPPAPGETGNPVHY